jgi:hypothetical protein
MTDNHRSTPYGIGNAIADIGSNVNQQIDRYAALPPLKKNLARATRGTALIAFCAHAVFWLDDAGVSPKNMVLGFVHAWTAPPEIMIPTAIWTAMLGLGVLWVVVGVQGARGPRDVMGAFWSLVSFLIFVTLARWWGLYLPADWIVGNFFLKGFYYAGFIASAVRFWLSVRGTGGDAFKIVERQIQRQTVNWRLGKRRQF